MINNTVCVCVGNKLLRKEMSTETSCIHDFCGCMQTYRKAYMARLPVYPFASSGAKSFPELCVKVTSLWNTKDSEIGI